MYSISSQSDINRELIRVCEEMELEDELIELCRKADCIEDLYDQEMDNNCRLFEEQTVQFGNTSKITFNATNPEVKKTESNESTENATLTENKCNEYSKGIVFKRDTHNVKSYTDVINSDIETYRIENKPNEWFALRTPKSFLTSKRREILRFLERSIEKHNVIKVHFVLHVKFVELTEGVIDSFVFPTFYTLRHGDNLNIIHSSLVETLPDKVSDFEKDSAWGLVQAKELEININRTNSLYFT